MKITIHKFKTLQDLTIQVPAEITGGNGTGKTSILEAISFCLTGKGLDGKEMAQIYDNRVDLHDAVADVSFFDDYGNEYRRKVEPVFETKRDGAERLKILRSTKCTKNGIDANDFADEFHDFYKFGTDYFFAQKETDQRAIFIDLMKSLLPNFDVKEAQSRLDQLKKSQRDTIADIKNIRAMLKDMSNQEPVVIPSDLQKLEAEYQEKIASSTDNQATISKINAENNALNLSFRNKKNELEDALDLKIRKIKELKNEIDRAQADLDELSRKEFVSAEMADTRQLIEQQKLLKSKLDTLEYFDNVQDFGKKYALNNPIVSQNAEKIKALKENPNEVASDICPACGVASPEALKKSLDLKIGAIRQENRDLLVIDMREVNNKYLTVKDELERVEKKILTIDAENAKVLKANEEESRKFKLDKTNKIEAFKKSIQEAKARIDTLTNDIDVLSMELGELKPPKLKTMPTEMTISDELKQAHIEFVKLRDEQVGSKAVNENNAKIKAKKEAEIVESQTLIANLDYEIVELQNAISDYFSNLDNIVAKEFAGKIKIGVQLLEYVITKNEYKDCFKITADEKVFPHECNGALINNVKLQVLASLQRLKGYTGITIMDNAEANTTQPLNGEGLNLVVARANESNELIIK